MAVGGRHHTPVVLPPGKGPGTHHTRGWIGPRAGLDERGKSRPPPRFDPWTIHYKPVASVILTKKYRARLLVASQISVEVLKRRTVAENRTLCEAFMLAGRHGNLHPDGSFRTTGSP